ncbi:MAG TPA: chemotaxis protein CheW [bacterium]|nr:chemotaxis protein CheW [bacterium]HPN43202.1 chemotaxis protein CheW [bacterium]
MELLTKSQDANIKKSDSNIKKNLEHEGKYLTFVIANEEYGLQINRVKEINGLMPITRVPRTPKHILGVINLRGKIVSVMDMRVKFGMEQIAATQETCIIVVQTKYGEKGILVDKVSEVINIQAEEIEPVPEFGVSINTDYILGIGKTATNVIILLDIDKVLSINQSLDATLAYT